MRRVGEGNVEKSRAVLELCSLQLSKQSLWSCGFEYFSRISSFSYQMMVLVSDGSCITSRMVSLRWWSVSCRRSNESMMSANLSSLQYFSCPFSFFLFLTVGPQTRNACLESGVVNNVQFRRDWQWRERRFYSIIIILLDVGCKYTDWDILFLIIPSIYKIKRELTNYGQWAIGRDEMISVCWDGQMVRWSSVVMSSMMIEEMRRERDQFTDHYFVHSLIESTELRMSSPGWNWWDRWIYRWWGMYDDEKDHMM